MFFKIVLDPSESKPWLRVMKIRVRSLRATRGGTLPRAVAMAASFLPSAFQPQPLAGPRPTRKERFRRGLRRFGNRYLAKDEAGFVDLTHDTWQTMKQGNSCIWPSGTPYDGTSASASGAGSAIPGSVIADEALNKATSSSRGA